MSAVYRFLLFRPVAIATPALAAPGRDRGFHIAFLLLIVAILNAVDLAYTLFAHRMGLLDEMNPLAESFLSQGLVPSLISYKLLMVLAGSIMLWRVRRSGWAVPACWVLIAAYTGLAGMWYVWIRDVTQLLECKLFLG